MCVYLASTAKSNAGYMAFNAAKRDVREYGTQAVTWQTAMNPVIALELLASGTWSGAGVLGPEAFDAVPYLDLMSEGYGQSWGLREQA